MPTNITCASCGRQLLIGWAPNEELTCPHCKAKFRNPNYGKNPPTVEPVASTAIVPNSGDDDDHDERIFSSPSSDDMLAAERDSDDKDDDDREYRWGRHAAQLDVPDFNTDVRRNPSGGNTALGVAIALGVMGILVAFVTARGRGGLGPGTGFVLMVVFTVLDVVVSILCVTAIVRWGTAGVRELSPLRVIGLTFLSLVTILAVMIGFCVTCGVVGKM